MRNTIPNFLREKQASLFVNLSVRKIQRIRDTKLEDRQRIKKIGQQRNENKNRIDAGYNFL